MNEAPEVVDVDVVDVPAASPAPAPAAPPTAEPDATERPEGIPAAHLATGGLSAGAVALGAVYQLLGLPGLIGGAVLAGSGGVAYLRHRYHKANPHRGNSHRHGGGGGGRKESARTVTTSTRRPGGGGIGGLFGGGRSTGGGRSGGSGGGLFGKGGRGGGGLLGGLGRSANRSGTPGGGGGAGRGGRSGRPAAKGAGAGGRTGGAGRAFGNRARQMAHKARAAAARVSDATGGRAKKKAKKAGKAFGHAGRRVGRAVARQARRLGAAVDRRSGHRYSAAWKAIRQGGGLRAARRRAAAVLGGWDAQLTAGLLALVSWVVDRVKARKGASADADPGAQASASAETTEDTAASEPAVVHDGDGGGELPITATVACPRCGKTHTVTVERANADQTAVCECGYTIRFFRIAPQTPAEAASTGRGRHPYTASTTNTRRNTTMSVNPLAAAAAEVNAVAAAHAPADMWQVARELDQLSEVPANIGMALRTYTVRLQGEYPIHPAVVEALGELYVAHAQLVDRAQEIGALFRRVHEDDLKREEAPRTNEQAWNV